MFTLQDDFNYAKDLYQIYLETLSKKIFMEAFVVYVDYKRRGGKKIIPRLQEFIKGDLK